MTNHKATFGPNTHPIHTLDDDGYTSRFLHPDFETWDDLRVTPGSAKSGAVVPTWKKITDDGSGSTGVFGLAFAKNQDDEVYVDWQMPHGWKEGSTLHPHLHILSATAGTVGWVFEYFWLNINGEALGDSTILTMETTIAAEDVGRQLIAGGLSIDGTGKEISSVLVARIARDNSVDGNVNDDVFVLSLDCHVQFDALGSDEVLSKTLPTR